jgi:hypothetical protein
MKYLGLGNVGFAVGLIIFATDNIVGLTDIHGFKALPIETNLTVFLFAGSFPFAK